MKSNNRRILHMETANINTRAPARLLTVIHWALGLKQFIMSMSNFRNTWAGLARTKNHLCEYIQ